MNTHSAPASPGAVTEDGAYHFCVKRQLWRLPIGEVFEDYYHKQQFEKIAEIINQRGEVLHAFLCLASPFKEGQKLGPVCSAFFTTQGTILFREGSLKVFVRGETKEAMKKEITTGAERIKLGRFSFACDKIVEGIAINPKLPANFDSTANESRPDRHRAWWDVPYIEIYHEDRPSFVAHWKGNTRYDVRCLDGGAWDRPTCWGMFSTLEEALACTRKGPSWREVA